MEREIEIPVKRPRYISGAALKRVAAKAETRSFRPDLNQFDFDLDKNSTDYFPYWVGRIRTSKTRAVLPPKVIDFFVICNAVNAKYLVVRSMPPMKKINVEEHHLVEDFVTENEMKARIMPESIGKHINRQFIFGGATTTDIMERRLVYIPVKEVGIRKKGCEEYETHFINAYTKQLEGE